LFPGLLNDAISNTKLHNGKWTGKDVETRVTYV